MEKHAYLIMAHRDDATFRTLVSLLDNEYNDIYIHMDKKVKKYNIKEIEQLVKKSHIYHIERAKVSWGGYSLINCELNLLNSAVKNGKYQYYHLLSGQDLPLKTQKYIHNFFEKNKGKEFISFRSKEFTYQDRVLYFHPLQELLKRKNIRLAKISSMLQKPFVKRNNHISFQKGANWFSITNNLAQYVLNNRTWIKKHFKQTICADEIFLQTLIINSDFKNNLYLKDYKDDWNSHMRYIDWNRGSPYTFKSSDFDELVKSKALFARKFDSNIDSSIVNKIYDFVRKTNI